MTIYDVSDVTTESMVEVEDQLVKGNIICQIYLSLGFSQQHGLSFHELLCVACFERPADVCDFTVRWERMTPITLMEGLVEIKICVVLTLKRFEVSC